MARTSQIHVYAESLSNIRQVSISLCLLSPADSSTTVKVLADGVTLNVCHKGESEKLTLPDAVAAAGTHLLLTRTPQSQEGESGDSGSSDDNNRFYSSWRLPLVNKGQQLGYASSHPSSEIAPVPWTSSDLLPGSPVSCRLCGTVLITRGTIGAWKDLPAENWAEMMEFWHCHKPSHDHDQDHDDNKSRIHDHETTGDSHNNSARTDLRGYGANSVISSQSGIGFVDLANLFFFEKDCREIILSDSPPTRPPAGLPTFGPGSSWPIANALRHRAAQGCCAADGSHQAAVSCLPGPPEDLDQDNSVSGENAITTVTSLAKQPQPRGGGGVFCAKCHTRIGYYSLSLASIALFKWQIYCEATTPHLPLLPECFAATLVDRMSQFGSSKFLAMPSLEATPVTATAPSAEGAEGSETEKDDPPILHIWVLNNNIRYNSSSTETVSSAVKLLFKFIPLNEANCMLEDFNSDVQEVTLPREAVGRIVELLETSNNVLSSKEKSYREWKIGLLNRWEPPRV